MHTRCLYYPPTPFCLRRVFGVKEEREREEEGNSLRCTADCKITFGRVPRAFDVYTISSIKRIASYVNIEKGVRVY